MTDWIEWSGGKEPPVPDDTRVGVKFDDAGIDDSQLAGFWDWGRSTGGRAIVAYRFVPLDRGRIDYMVARLRAAGYTVTAPRTFADIEPMRAAPGTGTTYHMPVLDAAVLVLDDKWAGAHVDQTRFRRGLCYATREDAEIAARAMIELKGGVV